MKDENAPPTPEAGAWPPERGTAETALRESEARFREQFENANDFIFTADLDMRITSGNPAVARALGHSVEELIGHSISEFVPPEMWERNKAMLATKLAGDTDTTRYEVEVFDAQGERMTWEINSRLTRDASGAPTGLHAIGRDVTERKASEQALRESEARFRDLLRAAPVGVFVCDRDAVIQYYNERAATLWGRKPEPGAERYCGSTRLWLPSGEVLPHEESPVIEVMRTGEPASAVEVSIEQPDGTRLPVQVDFAALKDAEGEITGAITCFWDISERKASEQALRESEERFRRIADSTPAPMWVTRLDRKREFVNRAYVEFLGISYEEAVDFDWREILHPDDHDRIVAESIAGEASLEEFVLEARYQRKDGEWHWMRSTSQPRLDAKGELTGFIGVAHDVTASKAAEEALREAGARAASEATERSAILAQLTEGVIVTDAGGRIIFVNEAATRLHGVAALDVEPSDYSDTYHLFREDGSPHPFEELPLARAVMNGETVSDARWRIKRPDGSEVLAIGNAQPIRDGEGAQTGSVLTVRDDTRRFAAEAALRLKAAEFEALAENVSQLAWMAEADGSIFWYNRRWYEYTGTDLQSMKD